MCILYLVHIFSTKNIVLFGLMSLGKMGFLSLPECKILGAQPEGCGEDI